MRRFNLLAFILLTIMVAGCSSATDSGTTLPTGDSGNTVNSVPAAPTGARATAGDGQVVISWDTTTGYTYTIYWATSSGVTTANGTAIASASSPYSHSGLTNGTTYFYMITATNSEGEGTASAEVSAAPSAGAQAVTPGGITLSAASPTINILDNTIITANVLDDTGQIVPNGTEITFTLSNSALGSLSSTAATTTNGNASVVFTALDTAGTAVIEAVLDSISNSATITIEAEPSSVSTPTVSPSTLTVLGTASISVTVRDAASNLVKDGTVVNFSIDDEEVGTVTAKSTTRNGIATTTFTASNEPGAIVLTAQAGTISNSVAIQINPADTSSIEFVSATPSVIGIKGSGQAETSEIIFAVKDVNGNPVVDGIEVTFNLDGINGGESLSRTTSSTVDGAAKTILKSGTIAGPVRVVATVTGTDISSSSTAVSVGGGIPSFTHFDLSAGQINLAGLAFKNLTTTVTAYLADRFGNYNVLENTAVSFYAEAGAIDRNGVTDASGLVNVTFRTQDPMAVDVPAGASETSYVSAGKTYNPRDGWVTVLATTRGEEQFFDANSNGLYDSGEDFVDIGEPFIDKDEDTVRDENETYTDANSNGKYDIGEAFVDDNSDGVRDAGEEYIDGNDNGEYDGPNGIWDGDTMISKSITLIFSGRPDFSDDTTHLTPTTFNIADGDCQIFTLTLTDINQNMISPGSTIQLSTDTGKIAGGGTIIMPDGGQLTAYESSFSVCDASVEDSSGPSGAGVTAMISWKIGDDTLGVYYVVITGTMD